MRFTLVYDGPLPAQSAGNSRVPEKHALRVQFQSQLADLWETHPALRRHFKVWKDWADSHPLQEFPQQGLCDPSSGPANSASPIVPIKFCKVGKYHFISLVSDHTAMTCELEILFLRKEEKGYLVNQAGDLDNRIKVLFDALRVPLTEKEIPPDATLPDPFFCLLEDDRLITRVSVVSERLLEGTAPTSRNHVRLVVNVSTRAEERTWLNMGLAD